MPWISCAEPYSETGLPIPRFVALKSAETNMRKGPGTRYAIYWVYRRKHLPVEIINEFGHWRQVRDFEGITGWVHKGMVGADRYVMVKSDILPLHQSPDHESDVVVSIKSGVIAHMSACDANWCEVEVAGHEGWLPKSGIWGVYPQEVFE